MRGIFYSSEKTEELLGGPEPPRGNHALIILFLTIVKASLKKDFAILVDLLLEESPFRSKNS